MLLTEDESKQGWYRTWGIDTRYENRGGLLDADLDVESEQTVDNEHERTVYLLQRKQSKPGISLARTTGWIKRLSLRKAGVIMLSDVSYQKIDDFGLHIRHHGEARTLAVDHVIVCAGQASEDALYRQLSKIGQPTHVIGGAKKAAELDAETAIRQGMELAYKL
jgi:2,4-dienoyl-CoA reductase (NADPH2)